jgi:hypothetical protein
MPKHIGKGELLLLKLSDSNAAVDMFGTRAETALSTRRSSGERKPVRTNLGLCMSKW